MNYTYYIELGLKWVKVTSKYFFSHRGNKRVMFGREIIREYTD